MAGRRCAGGAAALAEAPGCGAAAEPARELFEACRNGDVERVKRLVRPENVNSRDTAGRKSSPLHFAAGTGLRPPLPPLRGRRSAGGGAAPPGPRPAAAHLRFPPGAGPGQGRPGRGAEEHGAPCFPAGPAAGGGPGRGGAGGGRSPSAAPVCIRRPCRGRGRL